MVSKTKKIRYQDCTQKGCSNKTTSVSFSQPVIHSNNVKTFQKVTKYEDIPKTFEYRGRELEEWLNTNYVVHFSDKTHSAVKQTKESYSKSVSHNATFRKGDIKPRNDTPMKKDEIAESNGAQWAQENDTRITPIGKFLRKTRFDFNDGYVH